VVPAPGVALDADEVRAALRGRVSAFKVPVHVVLVTADDIPWTASHKVRRGQLTDLLTARLAASDPA
jgi:fatty-acyl-CoA synthase